MTINILQRLAAADEASGEPKRAAVGGYARRAVEALAAHDWEAATDWLLKAIARRPAAYAPALALVGQCRAGATGSAARAKAARANGRKGGRPRKIVPRDGGQKA